MTAREVQQPVYEVSCDRPGCAATFRSVSPFSQRDDRSTRIGARLAGWDVPPRRGKGSRRETDYCPDHGAPAGEVDGR